MQSSGITIARNASWLMVSQLLTGALAMLLTLIMPRYLGVTAIGQLQLGGALWAIVGVGVTLGMDVLLTKEIARAPERAAVLLGTSLVLRTILYFAGFGLLAVYLRLVAYPADTVAIVVVIGLAQLFGQYSSVARAALQGLERMEYISLAEVGCKLASTVLLVALLLLGQGVLVMASVSIGTLLLSCMIQFYFLSRVQLLRLKVNWQLAKWMVRASQPYFLSSVFLILYGDVSIVVLSLLIDETGVGWFGAANRLLGPLLFIPTVFMTAAFPALARQAVTDSGLGTKLMRRSFELLFIVAVPLGLGILVIAQPLVLLLYGPAFANSGPVLAVLGVTLISVYLNVLIGHYLISVDLQNQWTLIMAIATGSRICLDLLLIPLAHRWFQNGPLGAAVALTVTELGMLMTGLVLLPRGTLGRDSAWRAGRTLLAGAGMLLAVWPWRLSFIAVPIVIGAVVYGVIILALRVVSPEDQRLLASLGHAGLARLRRGSPKPSQVS